jgi:8-oxo-dGTP pyrophosphatase MutT (NUDIX family)
VERSLIDDRARWLAVTNLPPAVVPAPLSGLVHAVAAARPDGLSRNDLVADTAAECQAAVLILIATDRDGGPDVLLLQRALNLRDHAGEVAFPGGAREDGDTGPPATAIREAVEETGVDPAGVEPLILLPRLHIPPRICRGVVTRPERFELPTFGSVDRRSIQLSYGRLLVPASAPS